MQQLSASDLERRAGMRRMKALALGLLVFVTVLFLVARWQEPHHSAGSATCAPSPRRRWSARSPTGSRSPRCSATRSASPSRTPRSSRIARTRSASRSASSCRRTSSPRRSSTSRLDQAHVGQRLGDVAARAGQRRRRPAARWPMRSAAASRSSTTATSAGRCRRLIERKIRDTSIAPLLGRAIDLGMDGGHHQRLLDTMLTGLGRFLDDNRVTFRERLRHRVAVVGAGGHRRPHLRQDLHGGPPLPRRHLQRTRSTRCDAPSIARILTFADRLTHRPRPDRQARVGEGGDARASRRAGVAADRCGAR